MPSRTRMRYWFAFSAFSSSARSSWILPLSSKYARPSKRRHKTDDVRLRDDVLAVDEVRRSAEDRLAERSTSLDLGRGERRLGERSERPSRDHDAERRRSAEDVLPRHAAFDLAAQCFVGRRHSRLLRLTDDPPLGLAPFNSCRVEKASAIFRRRVGAVAGLERHRRPRARAARAVRARADDRGGEGAPRPRRGREAELEREPLRPAAGRARRDPRGAREHLAVPRAAVHRLPQRGRRLGRDEPDQRRSRRTAASPYSDTSRACCCGPERT